MKIVFGEPPKTARETHAAPPVTQSQSLLSDTVTYLLGKTCQEEHYDKIGGLPDDVLA
jgi:hypothetical protein